MLSGDSGYFSLVSLGVGLEKILQYSMGPKSIASKLVHRHVFRYIFENHRSRATWLISHLIHRHCTLWITITHRGYIMHFSGIIVLMVIIYSYYRLSAILNVYLAVTTIENQCENCFGNTGEVLTCRWRVV